MISGPHDATRRWETIRRSDDKRPMITRHCLVVWSSERLNVWSEISISKPSCLIVWSFYRLIVWFEISIGKKFRLIAWSFCRLIRIWSSGLETTPIVWSANRLIVWSSCGLWLLDESLPKMSKASIKSTFWQHGPNATLFLVRIPLSFRNVFLGRDTIYKFAKY